MIHVKVDRASETAVLIAVDNASKGVARATTSGIHAGTIHLTSIIKRDLLSGQMLNRRSGNLSRAIIGRMESPTLGVVGVAKEAPYAEALHDGSRPHMIEAKPGKMLAFVPSGVAHAIRGSGFVSARSVRKALAQNVIFRKRVFHPGNPPFPFMEIGLAMATPRIRQLVEERIAEALARAGKR